MEKKSKYSTRKLAQCLADIRNGKLSQRRAAQVYGIPRTTICDKLNGKSPPVVCAKGPEPSLGRDSEKSIVEWAQNCANKGFHISKDSLAFTIKTILQSIPDEQKKKRLFRDKPGKHLVDRFLKRNAKEIRLQCSQSLRKARHKVTEQDIRQWFTRTEEILKMDNCFDALTDPCRIFITDETAIYLNQGGKCTGTTEKPTMRVNNNDDKSNVTVLFTASADGCQVPPYILSNCNEDGWTASEKFYEYVVNIFHPYLERNNVQRPVILFMNNHSSHLSIPLSNFCAKNKIVPVCLISSATQVLQPFSNPVKTYWRKFLRNYWLKNNYGFNKSDMAKEMELILTSHESNFKTSIQNGFQATGLYPFNVDNVKFEKHVVKDTDELMDDLPIESTPKFTLLQLFESRIPPDVLEQFYECKSHGKWRGDIELSRFFETWLDVHSREDSYDEYVPYQSVKSNDECKTGENSRDFSTAVLDSELDFNDDENYEIEYNDAESVEYHSVTADHCSPEFSIEDNIENVTIVSTSEADSNVQISIPSTSFSNANSGESNVHISIPSTSILNSMKPISEGNSRESKVHISIPLTLFSNVTPIEEKDNQGTKSSSLKFYKVSVSIGMDR